MEMHDIVMRLIGEVEPLGETRRDAQRRENLKDLIALTDSLLGEIENVTNYKDRPEFSMNIAAKDAREFLTMLNHRFADFTEGDE